MSAANPRGIAWQLLNRWETKPTAADELLESEPGLGALDARDRRLAQELFFGCIRRKATLDWIIAVGLKQREQRIDTQNLLRLALYQLFFLEKIPAHALVNETVSLAKGGKSFLNAVLRRACAEEPRLREALVSIVRTDPFCYYSVPEWLWRRWIERYGEADARALGEWNNTPPPLVIRINTLKTTRDRLMNEMQRAKLDIEPSATHPLVARLKNAGNIATLGAFERGEFYVQDESTLAAVDALAPCPEERIADLCAAPGGKTSYIAALMQNRGRLIACDESENRLKLVAENCARLGVNIVATLCGDARTMADELEERSFDGVLVDAPCTNTGVLRRRVDARWRLREKDIARLAAAQLGLCLAGAKLVKRGGRFVYSTCSLEPEENVGVMEKFLAQERAFTLEKSCEMFPPRQQTDGGYWALLRKT